MTTHNEQDARAGRDDRQPPTIKEQFSQNLDRLEQHRREGERAARIAVDQASATLEAVVATQTSEMVSWEQVETLLVELTNSLVDVSAALHETSRLANSMSQASVMLAEQRDQLLRRLEQSTPEAHWRGVIKRFARANRLSNDDAHRLVYLLTTDDEAALAEGGVNLETIIRLRQSLHDVLRVMETPAQEPPA